VEALWNAAVIGFGNELGHFCLWLALAVALLQAIVPLIGAQRQAHRFGPCCLLFTTVFGSHKFCVVDARFFALRFFAAARL
jgi:cytochrome c biogenesis factor